MQSRSELLGIFGWSLPEKIAARSAIPIDKVKKILLGYKTGLDIPKAKYPDPGMVAFIARYTGYSETIIKPVLDQFTGEADRASVNAQKNLSFSDQVRRVIMPVVILAGLGVAAYSMKLFSPLLKK
jgi:hypothetical protein